MTTKIEWADETWNPVTGCTPVSEGCRNCYARRMARRLRGRFGYPQEDPFGVTFHPDRLDEPSRWTKPRRVFVCSMGDLFHEDVPPGWLFHVFYAMAAHQRHTFVLLTKRPSNILGKLYTGKLPYFPVAYGPLQGQDYLPNVWLGVTAENEEAARQRIPHLLRCRAALRFVSVEPMLGRIDLRPFIGPFPTVGGAFVDWVVIGCETGPGRRPCRLEWVTDLIGQADTAGVPVFVKQLDFDGRVSRDPAEWPEDLRRREIPGENSE